MLKRNNFEKKYPVISKYIKDETVRKNMLENEDLYQRYNGNLSLIKSFIHELEKYFDEEKITEFIIEVIFKLPEPLLKSFIISYLNSNDESKSNKDVLIYYKKVLDLGNKEVAYIEKNGIITNRTYKELPFLVAEGEIRDRALELDKEYESMRLLNEVFNNEKLENVYYGLNLPEKELVNSLVKNGTFNHLTDMFRDFDISLRILVYLLSKYKINSEIISNEVVKKIGLTNLMILICNIVDNECLEVVDGVKYIISKDKLDLLDEIIKKDYIIELKEINNEDLISLDEDEILNKLAFHKIKRIKSKMKEEF